MGVLAVLGALGEGETDLESPFGKSFSSRAYFSFQGMDGVIMGGIAGIWAGVHLSGGVGLCGDSDPITS